MPSVGSRAVRYPRTSDPTPRFAVMPKKVVRRRAVVVLVEGCLSPFKRWHATANEKLDSKFIPVTPSRRARGAWMVVREARSVLASPVSKKPKLARVRNS
jgi:hypothetical protein